ncbi:alpha/beta fold hydrolase [Alloactinosynnema sp. L-07]|uniref:alpha/beta fold hydrolase n=1 Tax=Alloactinosynnema sp. L-07 TaxID=1653480 RepID=UPI0006B44813|nr:alpha/beta hydrolase [Alloactinosynnema sp. L-07]
MSTVTSADGTTIAYETHGTGPALIIVDGALCHREMGPSRDVAKELADRFTVYCYDRRGRGGSGDTPDYSVDRETDDLAALIEAAGGSAHVVGFSSGAALALAAAQRGLPITRLATYEAPFIVDGTRPPIPASTPADLRDLVQAGKRGAAVKRFLKLVGTPAVFVAIMPLIPVWKKLTGVAHTLPYDLSIVTPNQAGHPLPAGTYAGIKAPTLVLDGGKSPQWIRTAQSAIADSIAGAEYRTLPGQTHMVKAKVLAPELAAHFAETTSARRTPRAK